MAGVVLSGYYGFGNSGDEAVLFSIISQLKETDPTVAVTVLSNRPEMTSREYGVHAVNRWRLRAVVRAIRDSSLLISGGGSLLQDVTGIRSIIYYLGIVFLAKLYGKPVMFYAQGIGPVSTWLGRTLTRTVVNRVDTVSVRDPRSAEELAQMGVTRPPVRVTADPVFALEPSSEDIESAGDVLSGCGLRSGLNADSLVGLSLRDWPGCADLKAAAARVCDDLVVDGKQVIFIPMHFPGDVKVSLEVASMMRQPAAVLDKRVTVPVLLGIFSLADFVIGMRLHSLILAAAAGVPSVGISYDPKVQSFITSLGQIGAGNADCTGYEELHRAVWELLDNYHQKRQLLQEKLPSLRERTRKDIQAVLSLL